jgi:hypothetical protein
VPNVLKSGSLKLLEISGPVMGLLYLLQILGFFVLHVFACEFKSCHVNDPVLPVVLQPVPDLNHLLLVPTELVLTPDLLSNGGFATPVLLPIHLLMQLNLPLVTEWL